MLFIIIVIIFLLIYFLQFFRKSTEVFFISLFSLSIFFIVLLGIKANADSEGYLYIYENNEANTDFLFRYLSDIFKSFGLDYFYLYQFHIFLIGILFVYFISRFTNLVFLILISYLTILYVPLCNQIRYFLGFGFFLNSIYFWYINKKRYVSYALFLFAILSHSSIILLYGFIFLNKIKLNSKFFKYSVIVSGILFITLVSIKSLGFDSLIGGYNSYFTTDNTSSLAGGLYNIFFYLILIILLFHRSRKAIRDHHEFANDKNFQILLRLSIYTIIFIPSSLYFQILAHRFIHASLLIWLCFYAYSLSHLKSFKIYSNHVISLFITMVLLFYYTYFFSEFVLGETSFYLTEFIKSFNSIDYLPDLNVI